MNKNLTSLFLVLLMLFCGVTALANPAQNDVMPTEIPWDPIVQVQTRARLAAIPADKRTLVESRQLVLLAISTIDEGQQRSAQIYEMKRMLTAALARYPNDPELMAFEGTLSCMEAGLPGLDGMTAMTYARLGFRKLDAAVANNPAVLGVRLQRALTFLRSPSFLGKGRLAQADFEYLLQNVPNEKSYNGLRAMLLFHLGESQASNGLSKDAAESWVRAVDLSAPGWSGRAAARLR
jgi:hypothetical protein